MKKTVYKCVTVYIKQEIEYNTEEELEEKDSELETHIQLDLDNMQDGGSSTYEYRTGFINDTDEETFKEIL